MIGKVINTLHTSFIEDQQWYLQYYDEDILKQAELKSFLNVTLIEYTKLLGDSVIIGEYVKESSTITDTLERLSKSANQIYDNITTAFVEDPFLVGVLADFIKGINFLSSEYSKFSMFINTHNSNPSIDIVFSSSTTFLTERFERTFDTEVINEISNFYRLLTLNQFDHFFDESISYFKQLVEFENNIINLDYPVKHISAIKEKLGFLKYKWTIRQITTSKVLKNSDLPNKGYLIDKTLFPLTKSPGFSTDNSKLTEWKEYLENHYEYSDVSTYSFQKYEVLSEKDDDELTFEDLHFLIKYYKDVKPNYENLKEIVSKFESKRQQYTTHKSLFYKNLNYALNNQFSFLIDRENPVDEDVKALKIKIDSLHNKTGNNNFFVDFKYLKYKINRFTASIDDRAALEIEGSISDDLLKIKELLVSCEKKISWAESHHNLLYQLPYDESLVNYNSESIDKVYFASSFLLPLSVEQISTEFKELKLDFETKYQHYDFLSFLNKELIIIKELKNNAESIDKKSIETITIFTAVIAFLVGTISGFSFIDTFTKALIFCLIYTLCLFTFVVLIFISTKGIKKVLDYKKSAIALYIGIFALVGFLFYYKETFGNNIELEKFKKETNTYSDTLNVQRKRIDEMQKSLDSLKKGNFSIHKEVLPHLNNN